MTKIVLLSTGVAVLAGCSPRAMIVGAGNAAVGTVVAAGSAAGSVVGAAGSATSNAARSVGGGGGGGASVQTADATSQAATPTFAAPTPTVQAFRGGIAECLDALGATRVAATLAADGWAVANAAEPAAVADGSTRQRAVVKDGVRGSIMRGQRCTFVAEAMTGPTSRAIALEALRDHVGAGVTVAPSAQSPCGGYAFDLDGRPARMDFTAAPGGDCTGAGAGVTVGLI